MSKGKLQVDEISALTGYTITVPSSNSIITTTGGSMVAPGSVLQVKMARSGPAVQLINSATPVAITGLSVAITPYYATSLMVFSVQIQSNYRYVSSFSIFKDGAATVSTSGQTNSNEANMHVTTFLGNNRENECWSMPMQFSEVAGSTAARTYQVYATSAWGGTITQLAVNDRNGPDMAGFCHMMVMEVAQ